MSGLFGSDVVKDLRTEIAAACSQADIVGYYGDDLDSAVTCMTVEIKHLRNALENIQKRATVGGTDDPLEVLCSISEAALNALEHK